MFNPLADKNEDALESLSQETGLEKQVIRTTFGELRNRMNLNKFRKLPENETLKEDIGEEVKESGMSPLAYQEKVLISSKKKEISHSTFNHSEELLKESKSSPQVLKIKSEPRHDYERNPIKLEPRVKQEVLTIEEKARQYDELQAEFKGLQKQMEELKKRLSPGPVLPVQNYQTQYGGWQAGPPSYPHQLYPPHSVMYPPAPPPYMMTYPHNPPYQDGRFPGRYFPVTGPQPPVLLPGVQVKQEPVLASQLNNQKRFPPLRPKQ